MIVYLASIGVAGWEAIVYPSPGAGESDSPLPLAMSRITGTSGVVYHLLITIGLMGLIASFHGIILAAGRATLEFGRVRYLPAALGRVNERRKTPVNALIGEYGDRDYCFVVRQDRSDRNDLRVWGRSPYMCSA